MESYPQWWLVKNKPYGDTKTTEQKHPKLTTALANDFPQGEYKWSAESSNPI